MNLLEEIRTREAIDIKNVEKIDLEIGPVASTAAAIKEPKIGVEGKFSVWFLAALALAEGNVTLDKFTDEKVNHPALVRLRKKIETKLDPRIGFGARLCIKMKDGTEYKTPCCCRIRGLFLEKRLCRVVYGDFTSPASITSQASSAVSSPNSRATQVARSL